MSTPPQTAQSRTEALMRLASAMNWGKRDSQFDGKSQGPVSTESRSKVNKEPYGNGSNS